VDDVPRPFLGSFTPKLDEKGRFFLPTKFRKQLSKGMVIARQPDRCLAIWPTEAFIAEVERAVPGPSTRKRTRINQRMFASGASDEAADGQGRVTVPFALREYAGLKRDIAVIGAYNRLEIWDSEVWKEYQAAQEAEFAALDDDEGEME
jgi:MraZ protein